MNSVLRGVGVGGGSRTGRGLLKSCETRQLLRECKTMYKDVEDVE